MAKTRPSAVMINVKSHYNASRTQWFSNSKQWLGTGFILDKKKGIIATNKHIAGEDAVCSYDIAYSDGSHSEAFLLYSDPLYDFAFLKVDPKKMSSDSSELAFSKNSPKIHDEIFAITNTHGSQFTPLEGTISSLYENTGPFGDQSIEFSGVTSGGASGSPVVNQDGQLIGIIYGGRFTSGVFLPAQYLKSAIDALKKELWPQRNTAGFILKYTDIHDVLEKKLISQKALEEYQEKFKKDGSKIITISFMEKKSEARSQLQAGDIIWQVNGKIVGPHLLDIDTAVNTCKVVTLGIYRNGELIEKKINCIPIEKDTNQMVIFGNAIFSELSFSSRMRFDVIDKKAVFLHNAEGSSDFSPGDVSSLIQVTKIDEFDITSLDKLKEAIPQLALRKKLLMTYIDHGVSSPYENYRTIRNSTPQSSIIKYDKKFDDPKILEFNFDTHEWSSENIILK